MFNYTEFSCKKPEVDENGLSDIYVVFMSNGEMDLGMYINEDNKWYSITSEKELNGIQWYAPFDTPDKFKFSDRLYNIWSGKNFGIEVDDYD